MDEQGRGRSKVWTPLLFSVVLVIGMIFGFNLRDTLRNKRNIGTVIKRNDRLEEIIDLVSEKYVDTVNSNLLYKDAVSGILKSLDPHTVYISSEDLQAVNDDLEGGFSGIGVEFSIVRDTIEVVSVVEHGPAEQAGVELGDQLIKVGDSVVAGTGITSDRIVHLLKGKQHSSVSVTLKGAAKGALKVTTIIRDIIPIPSVDASIMLDSVTGFIKINRFSATTYQEFSDALKNLQSRGMKQLILDLRDNGGGYVDAATAIADDFLDDKKLIVYTKGIHTMRNEFRAGDKGLFEKGKLIVLVDESSASATEIVAGAIQDWDRGLIIGRRTFGKGLVQEQFEMPDGSALRLTVAKYYTPSGRCIQRSFARGKEAYMEDYEKRFETGELTGTKDTTEPADTTRYYTSKNRVVYGGGGIKPDVFVPYDTSKLSAPLVSMVYSQELKTAVWDYFIRNKAKLQYKNIIDFNESFSAQDQVLSNYLAMLKPSDLVTASRIIKNNNNYRYFKLQVKAQVARYLFRDNGYYAISLEDDEVVGKAMDLLHSDQYSKILGK